MGRKPIPIGIKKAKKTYRKHRDKNSPAPSKERMVAPSWLNQRAKRIFSTLKDRLDELCMASKTFTEALALLACRLEEVRRYSEIVETEGYMLERMDRNGSVILKLHPAVRMREFALNHAHKLLVEFGLTASSIQRVGKLKTTKKKNDFDGF
jgi:P27 family predicted phage terminase small subunit